MSARHSETVDKIIFLAFGNSKQTILLPSTSFNLSAKYFFKKSSSCTQLWVVCLVLKCQKLITFYVFCINVVAVLKFILEADAWHVFYPPSKESNSLSFKKIHFLSKTHNSRLTYDAMLIVTSSIHYSTHDPIRIQSLVY